MPADTPPAAELANFIDAHGRRVTASETRSGLAVILTRTAGEGLNGGYPALDREMAAVLGAALTAFANGETS